MARQLERDTNLSQVGATKAGRERCDGKKHNRYFEKDPIEDMSERENMHLIGL